MALFYTEWDVSVETNHRFIIVQERTNFTFLRLSPQKGHFPRGILNTSLFRTFMIKIWGHISGLQVSAFLTKGETTWQKSERCIHEGPSAERRSGEGCRIQGASAHPG